ncbi:MAG: hypothetical protein IT307_19840 [Chloroflexi bacterium]|nr:hypothetical protein [Chloroflexota bacterium]
MFEHSASGRLPGRCARERAAAEARAIGLVARSVTHELRQPLSLIAGYAEILAYRSQEKQDVACLVSEIRQAASRLAASLDVLDAPDDLPIVAFGEEVERHVLDLRPRLQHRARRLRKPSGARPLPAHELAECASQEPPPCAQANG